MKIGLIDVDGPAIKTGNGDISMDKLLATRIVGGAVGFERR